MNVNEAIKELVLYGIGKGLFLEEDTTYVINSILDVLKLDSFEDCEVKGNAELEDILKVLLDDAEKRGVIEGGQTERDLLDSKIMGTMVPFPRDVINKFWMKYIQSPKMASDWYYDFSQNTDYIRRYRIKKDMKWQTETEYGMLDITINLSKPEKDPKAIAAAKNAPQSGYPKCQLCAENEGYAGRMNHPGRRNHRVIPIKIGGSQWYFQYSPYVYYNEHCIAFNSEHMPMKIDRETFVKMIDFLKMLPHYFIGSNADLPIVGGSILSHDHFQGGNYSFAMEKAPVEKKITFDGYPDIEAGIVKWPMSVIRISGEYGKRVIDLAEFILGQWRTYTDEKTYIFAETDGEPHNTITPIARKRNDKYEIDLVLRNNITTEDRPLGVYHPNPSLHHIKKENIGLIEVMGLAVLPARLKEELNAVETALISSADLRDNELTAKHADWVEEFSAKYDDINISNVDAIVKKEVGLVFMQVLEDAGVYKRNDEGMAAFMRFIERCGGHEN
ncbi:MAG: UDP-glucose--hexose-1-phosphate uridylyltransferase [Clostridiales bacterium]|nr:UDP-glucose--hexose-1-phosphate uridylyltransferase [Clostridiales bacterium]